MRVLADFDRHGRSVADWQPYSLNDFPFTKRLMEEQELAVVNIDDPRADPAETAIMRHYGDKSLLLIPLVHRDRSVGLLEVLDRVRQRRFTRQELRLARALAGLAAVALRNAEAFGRLSCGDHDVAHLQTALSGVVDGLPRSRRRSPTRPTTPCARRRLWPAGFPPERVGRLWRRCGHGERGRGQDGRRGLLPAPFKAKHGSSTQRP